MSGRNSEVIRDLVRQAVLEALGQSPPPVVAESPRPASPREYYSPWTGNSYEAHPAQRRLVEIGAAPPLWQTAAGEPCPLENRPCDDCGKCRSLGF